MSEINGLFDRLGIYAWVFFVAIVGGFLNIGSRRDKSTRRKIGDLIVGVCSSCFCGWMSFEVIFFIYQSEKVALAGCGFFAWKGATWVGEVIDKAIDSKLKKRDDEYFGGRYSDYDDMPPMPRNMKDE